ncbi:MAG: hydrogenase small subunit [Chloroflexota bacterium]|nr:hydrogenase small subunit [Chloroflexota bacterium]
MGNKDGSGHSVTSKSRPRSVSRRNFLKLSGGAAAGLWLATVVDLPKLVAADGKTTAAQVAEIPVIWLAAGSCTGCSVSFLNTRNPRVQEVIVPEVVPGTHVSLRFHATIMAGEGEKAMEALHDTVAAGGFLLVAEGGFSTKDSGVYCVIGEDESGTGITALTHLKEAGAKAMAVISLGTCSAYGGVPAAEPNPTGIEMVTDIFEQEGITTPVINIPGCPPHPDWFVGTIVQILTRGLDSVEVDEHKRPKTYYGAKIHDNCPRRGYFDRGKFALIPSDPYCLYELGCKGPVTSSDCPIRLWNSGTNWCIGCGHPCIGCVEPGFPDEVGAVFERASGMKSSGLHDVVELVGLGLGAAAVAGIGAHLVGSAAAGRLKKGGE